MEGQELMLLAFLFQYIMTGMEISVKNAPAWRISMEIERKFLVSHIPEDTDSYKCRFIEQGYLSTSPVVRVRRDNDNYYLTYKSEGFISHEEYNLELTPESYSHLLAKADGNIITKKRYEIPIEYEFYMPEEICKKYPGHPAFLTVELDVFEGVFTGTVLAEVEFDTEEEAELFIPPDWFTEDVSMSTEYYNSTMSQKKF